MLRTMLVGLDGSEHGDSALELAIRWAGRFDALVVGLGCVDEPGLHGPEEYLAGAAYFERLNSALLTEAQARVEGVLSRAAIRCAEAGVAFKPLEDVGTPHVQILAEAQRFDLVVLGQQTHFRFGWESACDLTLTTVLAASPRPVVSVPNRPAVGAGVLVAYDGSLQAARTLAAFEASGLGQDAAIRVLSVAADRIEATRSADRAVEFLRAHGLHATPEPVDSDRPPANLILERAGAGDLGLLVMGAYGQPALREFFLGSTTRTLLEKCPAPMFLYH